ncbi:MAG: hypothetical protein ACLFOY_17810 [Desulfatibacillaceae bacterium]
MTFRPGTVPFPFKRALRHDPDSLDNRNLVLIDWLIPALGTGLKRYFRASVTGVERIPEGPALFVGNHNMIVFTLDTGILLAEVYKAQGPGALPYSLQHNFGVALPVLRRLAGYAGGMRATRANARKALVAGHKVLTYQSVEKRDLWRCTSFLVSAAYHKYALFLEIRAPCISSFLNRLQISSFSTGCYPGGDLDAARPFRHRNQIVFGGRTGYIRLALEQGVPIVPVVTAGAQSVFIILDNMPRFARALGMGKWARINVWPLTLSFPLGLTFGPPPFFIPYPARILLEIMEPIRFDRSGPEAARDDRYVRECAAMVEAAMQETLTGLARQRNGRKRNRNGPLVEQVLHP